eukprot:328056_1
MLYLITSGSTVIPSSPTAAFPINKTEYTHNDINFINSKIIDSCRSAKVIGYTYMTGSDALSSQASWAESVADPQRRLCTLDHEDCSEKHLEEITFSGSCMRAKCDGHGKRILSLLEIDHILKRDWRIPLSSTMFFGQG